MRNDQTENTCGEKRPGPQSSSAARPARTTSRAAPIASWLPASQRPVRRSKAESIYRYEKKRRLQNGAAFVYSQQEIDNTPITFMIFLDEEWKMLALSTVRHRWWIAFYLFEIIRYIKWQTEKPNYLINYCIKQPQKYVVLSIKIIQLTLYHRLSICYDKIQAKKPHNECTHSLKSQNSYFKKLLCCWFNFMTSLPYGHF